MNSMWMKRVSREEANEKQQSGPQCSAVGEAQRLQRRGEEMAPSPPVNDDLERGNDEDPSLGVKVRSRLSGLEPQTRLEF